MLEIIDRYPLRYKYILCLLRSSLAFYTTYICIIILKADRERERESTFKKQRRIERKTEINRQTDRLIQTDLQTDTTFKTQDRE